MLDRIRFWSTVSYFCTIWRKKICFKYSKGIATCIWTLVPILNKSNIQKGLYLRPRADIPCPAKGSGNDPFSVRKSVLPTSVGRTWNTKIPPVCSSQQIPSVRRYLLLFIFHFLPPYFESHNFHPYTVGAISHLSLFLLDWFSFFFYISHFWPFFLIHYFFSSWHGLLPLCPAPGWVPYVFSSVFTLPGIQRSEADGGVWPRIRDGAGPATG